MRQSFILVPILILALLIYSCTKSKSGGITGNTDTASIVGTWNWAFQTRAAWWDSAKSSNLTPATTGIMRTLLFDSTGHFSFIHNDSIFQDTNILHEPDYLVIAQPFQLLPAMATETDTGFYRVSKGIVGCTFQDTTTLQMNNITYQALISPDTLMVHLNPCLSRIVDIYIRKN
ncbi:MAG TPA: hypothetical protein VGR89_05180 [Puia sp.]|nr:hypothetical protein [Puia sp.]